MTWRDRILAEFTPQVAQLTLVADPDNLLTEVELLQQIRARGFEIIPWEGASAFRYIYESKYRSRQQDLAVVLKKELDELNSLPYDLLKTGRKIYFNIKQLFPTLSYSVVNALERSDFDALARAQTEYNPQQLGENASKDFVLRHVFDIAPELIKEPSDLLLILLSRHYRGLRLPSILSDRLIQLLRSRQLFSTWELESIIGDRQAFFAFLQEQWSEFVRQQITNSKTVSELTGTYRITSAEDIKSLELPFGREDIRVYIKNLFLEGYLQPLKAEDLKISTANLQLNWIRAGIYIDPAADQLQRFKNLLASADTSIPATDAKYQDWLKFAHTWAELIVLRHQTNTEFSELQAKVDNAFSNWVMQRYGGLYNQPTTVMVHQIPRLLARYCQQAKTNKVALLVLDGLAIDQWLILRKVLQVQRPQFKFADEAVFAWLPTITSVSRQAIFAGKPPIYFPASLETTAKEATLWTQFWTDEGFNPIEIAYTKGLGESGSISAVEKLLSHPKVRVMGLVIDKVDKIMHGMQLGTAGMHNQVQQWAELGFIAKLLDLLLENNFNIWLTSDHGNIEATGIGQPKEGAIADLRGERVRVYPDPILRAKVKSEFSDAIAWTPLGLPETYLPLLAPGRTAFIRESDRIVGHGGISLEELIVPLIHIEGKSK
ncbi:MAG TPA: BREX-3 system phosphatase PglZ [Oculatellaceae cyanobacterium]|jgi:hypothetical protein